MEQTPQSTPDPFDHPIDADELKAICDQYKALGYDKEVPFGELFQREQSQDFYLGMVSAFSMAHNLMEQVTQAEIVEEDEQEAVTESASDLIRTGQTRTLELLKHPISAFLIHSTMIAQEKVKRIITF